MKLGLCQKVANRKTNFNSIRMLNLIGLKTYEVFRQRIQNKISPHFDPNPFDTTPSPTVDIFSPNPIS